MTPYTPTPRTFIITPSFSYLRGYQEQVYYLRCYGDGQGCGEGPRNTLRDRLAAQIAGERWVSDGIAPCHQGFSYGLPIDRRVERIVSDMAGEG